MSVCAYSEVRTIFRYVLQSKKKVFGGDDNWPLPSVRSSVTYYY